MSLKRQLLMFSLVLLILPVLAWQAARQIESALRSAENRALLAIGDAMANNLQVDNIDVSVDRLRVRRIDFPISVDGYDDEWTPWREYGQPLTDVRERIVAHVWLATDLRRLYGLVRAEAIPANVDLRARVTLGELAFDLVAGDAETRIVQPAGLYPAQPVSGVWRRADDDSWQLEFSAPWRMAEPSLAIEVSTLEVRHLARTREIAASPIATPDLLPVTGLDQQIANLVPQDMRAWIVDTRGWVYAAAAQSGLDVSGNPSGWRSRIYRWMRGGEVDPPQIRRPGETWQLAGREIEAAARGERQVRLQLGVPGQDEIASAAIPIADSHLILVLEAPSRALLLATNRAFVGTVVLSAGTVILTITGLMMFAGSVSFRIRRLRDAAEAVGRGEQEDFRPSRAGDEIGDLSRSFADLVIELGQYNRYLQALASRLAHELGTPLAVVRSSLDNLQAEALSESASKYVSRAADGAERLRAILRAMSEARRLEQAIQQDESEPVDLVEVVSGCVTAYAHMDDRHRWTLDLDVDRYLISGSGELLAQALDKLSDNARGFTPPGGLIAVTVSRRGNGVQVRFQNEGPMLPANMEQRLFESMVSVREDTDFHLGLGLHIVRLVARAHGGRVTARNLNDGSGVEFVLWFPGVGLG